MISVADKYINEQYFEEGIGGALAVAAGGIFLYKMASMSKKSKRQIEKLEDTLLSFHKDDYLTINIELTNEEITSSFKDNFSLSGRFRKKYLSNRGLVLIANRKTVNFVKQKFGNFPMFKILGTNSEYKASFDKFLNDHQKLFKDFEKTVNNIVKQGRVEEEISANLIWMLHALRPFLEKNPKTKEYVSSVSVQSVKPQTVSIES